ncbi:hypothetical protein JCM10207_005851 [Rhodosporidiobolus poonsookiae]
MLASLASLIAAAAVFSSTASASPVEPRAVATHYSNAKWQYKGCYKGIQQRYATSEVTRSSAGACLGTLNGQPLDQIYGAISGTKCYGLKSFDATTVKVDDWFCNTPCEGNTAQLCGAAPTYFEVFDRIPRHWSSTSGSWKWNGCYTGFVQANQASGLSRDTVQKCAGLTQGQPSDQTAIAVSGTTCYGLRGIPANVKKVANSLCSQTCEGDDTQLCGATTASGAPLYWEVVDRIQAPVVVPVQAL